MDGLPDIRPSATGNLLKTPMAHLTAFMAERKLDGSIVFCGEDGSQSTVVYSQGAPAKARTSYPSTHLGRVLVQLNVLDEPAHDRTLAQSEQQGGLHGELLVSLGIISLEQLLVGLREQLMRRMIRLFEKLPDESTYFFYGSVNLLHDWAGPELTPIDPMRLLWEGVHQRPNHAAIEPTLARTGELPVRIRPGAMLDRFGFEPPQRTVLDVVRARPASIGELLGAGLLPVREMKLLLYVLLISKNLEVTTPVPASAPSPGTSAPRHPSAPDSSSGAAIARVKLKTAVAARGARPAVDVDVERKAFRQRLQSIVNEDFFAILGVSRDAPPDTVRSAYFELAKRWHPDRVPAGLEDVREDAGRIFARISDAFQTLSEPAKRQHYIDLLARSGSSSDEQETVQRVVHATLEFQKAQVFVRRRDFAQGFKHAKDAYDGAPDQPDHAALYAWVLANQPERMSVRDFAEPLRLLSQAIEVEPRCEHALFYRGTLLKMQNKLQTAVRDFRAVVALNPHNIDAAREIRLFELRGNRPDSEPEITLSKTSDENVDWKRASVSDILGKLLKKK